MLNQKNIRLLFLLWRHLKSRRQRQFFLLIFLMVVVALVEVISIGAVIPFLAILLSPDMIFNSHYINYIAPFFNILGISDSNDLLLPITILFSFAALFAGGMRLLLLWTNIRFSFATGSDLGIDIYRRTIHQPYSTHCKRHSSEIINGISHKTNVVIYNILLPLLTVISSSILLLAILLGLFFLKSTITLAVVAVLALIYLIMILLTRRMVKQDSESVARESTKVIKSLQEGLGGIRDVLIDGSQEIFCNIFRNADIKLRRAQGRTQFIAQFPRYIMEAVGIVLIASLAFWLSKESEGVNRAIPILGALALGAQRLLPILQQAYSSITNIQGGFYSLEDIVNLLEQPYPSFLDEQELKKILFSKHITLKKIDFKYNLKSQNILNQLDLKIRKGGRIAFIGKTGSGKTTLADIIMGLLKPNKGTMYVDDIPINSKNIRSWQLNIAHVPQFIFLSDSSIEENIAFGVPYDEIDHNKVVNAARNAQIADIIESWPNQYKTNVGEGGIKLSGGQRQRIGIARALYKEAELIIFDEATSSLDGETEIDVMRSIDSLSKKITLIIIAHRLSTIKNCNEVFKIDKGKIIKNT